MAYKYRDSTGRYYDTENNRFVSRSTIIIETEKEAARLRKALKSQTQEMLDGKITMQVYQRGFTQLIKESHIRMSELGAGGADRMTNAHYGSVGGMLRREYARFHEFSKGIANGEYSEKYILNRAGLYAASTRRSFFKGEQISRAIAGVVLAARVLDSQAEHCQDCLGYTTNGEYVPIEDIVVPGEACACGGRCRCSIKYKSAQRGIVDLSDRLELILDR